MTGVLPLFSRPAGSITLDQLIALNDEIAALARAGVPLEQGLRALGQDLPGRLGRLALALGQRLESGKSLTDALEASSDSFPEVYRAVVAAGLRTGRLAAALEGISTTARRVGEMRRVMIVSWIYPLIVLAVATLLFLFVVVRMAPEVSGAYAGLDVPRPAWYQVLLGLSGYLERGLPWFWLVVLVLFAVWVYRSTRAVSLRAWAMSRWPTIGRLLHAGRMATFAELLALMVEQEVPLDEAVVLSAEASGDRALRRAGRALAAGIERGETAVDLPAGFPPLLGWLIVTGTRHEHLVKTLRQTAASYRRRALHLADWIGIYVPIIFSASIGGGVALFYVLLVLGPFYYLLYQLSYP